MNRYEVVRQIIWAIDSVLDYLFWWMRRNEIVKFPDALREWETQDD